MGGRCGYLALLGGLSGGAVRVYLHEEGITLRDLSHDVERMVDSFRVGQRLFLTVMNEKASPMYTSDFLCRLFEQESQGLFDAREVVLGQTQQGGTPTPFDRILGTRLAAHSIDWLSNQIDTQKTGGARHRAARGPGAGAVAAAMRRNSPTGTTGGRWISGGCSCGRSSTCSPAGSQ